MKNGDILTRFTKKQSAHIIPIKLALKGDQRWLDYFSIFG